MSNVDITIPSTPRQVEALPTALTCSMNAHKLAAMMGYETSSYGVGSQIKMPGQTSPNTYPFGTPYNVIYEDLCAKGKEFYTRNELLQMIDRDRRVKNAPEKWQLETNKFDLIICFEDRILKKVIDDIVSRNIEDNMASLEEEGEEGIFKRNVEAHVVSVHTVDSIKCAVNGANIALALIKKVYEDEAWKDNVHDILDEVCREMGQERMLHSVMYY